MGEPAISQYRQGMAAPWPIHHHTSCQGHINCTKCKQMTCSRPVVWDQDGEIVTVVCLACSSTFNVENAADAI